MTITLGSFRPDPKPVKRDKKPASFLKQRSKKKAKDDAKYYKSVKVFKEGRICQRCNEAPANENHHKKGREGYADKWAYDRGITLLHDQRFWLAVCTDCHRWIEANPLKATELGFTETRADIITK